MAGTITYTQNILDLGYYKKSITAIELLISWVGDASDGTVPELPIDEYSGWYITKIITKPGTPSPTTLYDITLIDADGLDMADGALLDRSATVVDPKVVLTEQIGKDGFTVTIANQAVHSAQGTIRMFLNRGE